MKEELMSLIEKIASVINSGRISIVNTGWLLIKRNEKREHGGKSQRSDNELLCMYFVVKTVVGMWLLHAQFMLICIIMG